MMLLLSSDPFISSIRPHIQHGPSIKLFPKALQLLNEKADIQSASESDRDSERTTDKELRD